MTDQEKAVVKTLNHPLYTVSFLEEWIDRNDNVYANAPAALQAIGAKGYYEAVKRIVETQLITDRRKSVTLNFFSNPRHDEKDTVFVGTYVYATEAAEEFGFTKNNLYEIFDTNGFDTVLMMDDKGEKHNMSVEYFRSYCSL